MDQEENKRISIEIHHKTETNDEEISEITERLKTPNLSAPGKAPL